MKRDLTPDERTLITRVAAMLDEPEASTLLDDMRNARAEPMLGDGSIIRFHIEGYRRPAQTGQHTWRIEGTMKDSDGALVSVLLFADPADRLFELEYVRWHGGSLLNPDWATITLADVRHRLRPHIQTERTENAMKKGARESAFSI